MSNDIKNDLPEQIVKLAKAIGKDLKYSDTGVGEEVKDLYEKHLPEGHTIASIKALQAHDSDFLAALALAAADAGDAFFKKHKDINDVSVEVKAGKNTMGVVYTREKTVTVPAQKGGEVTQKVKYGQIKPFFEAYAAGPNRGAMKKVRDYVSNRAEEAAKS